MSTRVELRIHYYSGWLGGWLDGWLVEIKTTLASVEVEVELSWVEAELGNTKLKSVEVEAEVRVELGNNESFVEDTLLYW